MKRLILAFAVVAVVVAVAPLASATPRSGTLKADKNCDNYTGLPGSYCTFYSSNVDWAPVGTKSSISSQNRIPVMPSLTRRGPVTTRRSAIAISLTGTTELACSPVEQGSSLTSMPRSTRTGGGPTMGTVSTGTGKGRTVSVLTD